MVAVGAEPPRGPHGCGQLPPGLREREGLSCLSQLPFWPSATAAFGTKAPIGS